MHGGTGRYGPRWVKWWMMICGTHRDKLVGGGVSLLFNSHHPAQQWGPGARGGGEEQMGGDWGADEIVHCLIFDASCDANSESPDT